MSVDSATITKKFSTAFDSSNKDHVVWFQKLYEASTNEKPVDVILKENPFKINVSKNEMLEWVHIQFVLAMKYTGSVLTGGAWVPPQTLITREMVSQ
jgi:hypothetical protein